MKNRTLFGILQRTKYRMNDKILELLTYLNNNCLLDGDKIRIPIVEIEIPNIDEITKTKLFEELLSVTVNMVDNGEETDYYFIHQ